MNSEIFCSQLLIDITEEMFHILELVNIMNIVMGERWKNSLKINSLHLQSNKSNLF